MRSSLILLFTAVFSLCSSSIFAQEEDEDKKKSGLYIWGWSLDEDGKKTEDVIVKLFEYEEKVDQLVTTAGGRFDFNLDLDKDYYIRFIKDGYVDKIVWVDTKEVPEDDRRWSFENGPFKVRMVPEWPGVDFNAFTRPIAKIAYNPLEQLFVNDRQYTTRIQREVDEIARQIEKAKDRQARIQKELDEEFELALQDGAFFEEEGDLENALMQYEAAISIKPDDKKARKLFDDLADRIDAERSDEERYLANLDRGDKALDLEQYEDAKNYYVEASNLKPDEEYPKEQIQMINATLAEMAEAAEAARMAAKAKKEADEMYFKTISKADRLFAEGALNGARELYVEAKIYREMEEWPDNQIALIDAKLAEYNAAYDRFITTADSAYEADNFQAALEAYVGAYEIYEREYPLAQIQICEVRLDEKRSTAERYESAMYLGQKAVGLKQWETAKEQFERALALVPEDVDATAQLSIVNAELEAIAQAEQERLAAEEARLAKIESDYQAMIARAEEAYAAENYDEAISLFGTANSIKNDPYPKQKINEIEAKVKDLELMAKNRAKLEAEAAKLEEEYAFLMNQGDLFLGEDKYDAARKQYEDALKIFPERSEPGVKIGELDKILAEIEAEKAKAAALAKAEEERREQYNAIMAEANTLFEAEKYLEAKNKYFQASELQPSETLPGERIEAINQKILDQEQQAELKRIEEERKARIQAEFDQLIAEGDAFENEGELEKAADKYDAAVALMPSNNMAANKLRNVNNLLEEKRKKEAQWALTDTELNYQLAKEYPQGKTVKHEEEADKVVTIVIIVTGNRGDQYRYEKYSWGQKYFSKNGKPYNEANWVRETGEDI